MRNIFLSFLFLSISSLCLSSPILVNDNGYVAYIQTHNFDLSKLSIDAKGYAFFLASNKLKKTDQVYVGTPKNNIFPDDKLSRKELPAFEARG